MNFQEQMRRDLTVCFNESEFAISIVHTFGNQSETIPVLFVENAQIILKKNNDADYSFEGVESVVPMITILNEDATNITIGSFFNINDIEYEIIHREPTIDELKIYLGRV